MSRLKTRLPGVYVIGLTGGIASGKSTVSSMLTDLGAEVIDADEISHQVTVKGSRGLRQITDKFGRRVLNTDGSLNRKKLGRIIFHDEVARQELEAVIHPLVMDSIRERLRGLSQDRLLRRWDGEKDDGQTGTPTDAQAVKRAEASPGQAQLGGSCLHADHRDDVRQASALKDGHTDGQICIAVLDIPLLFEVGAESLTDEVWVVAVDRETQVLRLMERDGYSRDEADSRIDAQMPLSEKVKRATEVIDNQGDLMQTRERAEELWFATKRKILDPTRN